MPTTEAPEGSRPRRYTGKQLRGDAILAVVFTAMFLGLWALEKKVSGTVAAYAERGVTVTVEVVRVTGQGKHSIVHFRHLRDGQQQPGKAKTPIPVPRPGDRVVGRYLPEDPSQVRLQPVDEGAIEGAGAPFRGLRWLLAAPVALLVVARTLWATGRDPRRHVGWLTGLILVGVLIAVNFLDDVAASHVQRLGPTLIGLPVSWAVSLLELLLAPVLLVWASAATALMRGAARSGASMMGLGFVLWAIGGTIPEPLRKHQRPFRWSSAILLAVLVAAIIGLGLTDPPG